ncbi:hypothetical protein OF83DRAFT_1089549, partial [Amylostereum chailletii]
QVASRYKIELSPTGGMQHILTKDEMGKKLEYVLASPKPKFPDDQTKIPRELGGHSPTLATCEGIEDDTAVIEWLLNACSPSTHPEASGLKLQAPPIALALSTDIYGDDMLVILVLGALGAVSSALGPVFQQPTEGISDEAYDFIAVGGSVVVSRLSEDAETMVLLIEAGGSDFTNQNILVPGFSATLSNSHFDWNFTTTTQTSLNNRSIKHLRGHVLGRSTAISTARWCYASRVDLRLQQFRWNTVRDRRRGAPIFDGHRASRKPHRRPTKSPGPLFFAPTWTVNSTTTLDNLKQNATLAVAAFDLWKINGTGLLGLRPANRFGWLRVPVNASMFEGAPDLCAGATSAYFELILRQWYPFSTDHPSTIIDKIGQGNRSTHQIHPVATRITDFPKNKANIFISHIHGSALLAKNICGGMPRHDVRLLCSTGRASASMS